MSSIDGESYAESYEAYKTSKTEPFELNPTDIGRIRAFLFIVQENMTNPELLSQARALYAKLDSGPARLVAPPF